MFLGVYEACSHWRDSPKASWNLLENLAGFFEFQTWFIFGLLVSTILNWKEELIQVISGFGKTSCWKWRVQSASGKSETGCVAGRVCCYCGVLLPSASKIRGKNNEFGLVREEKAVLHIFVISEKSTTSAWVGSCFLWIPVVTCRLISPCKFCLVFSLVFRPCV